MDKRRKVALLAGQVRYTPRPEDNGPVRERMPVGVAFLAVPSTVGAVIGALTGRAAVGTSLVGALVGLVAGPGPALASAPCRRHLHVKGGRHGRSHP